jgi:hypothetical protein
MGLLDGILKQVSGSPDTIAELASKVGIDPGLAEKAVAALGASHPEPGDTVELAAGKTGLDFGKLTEIVGQLGGEGALGDIAGKMAGNSQLEGLAKMLDRDGDGNPLDDIAGMAKGLFGKD